LKENYQIDFAFIKGQKFAKRALEISASGATMFWNHEQYPNNWLKFELDESIIWL